MECLFTDFCCHLILALLRSSPWIVPWLYNCIRISAAQKEEWRHPNMLLFTNSNVVIKYWMTICWLVHRYISRNTYIYIYCFARGPARCIYIRTVSSGEYLSFVNVYLTLRLLQLFPKHLIYVQYLVTLLIFSHLPGGYVHLLSSINYFYDTVLDSSIPFESQH